MCRNRWMTSDRAFRILEGGGLPKGAAMINWIAVLRRMLQLYNVKTQQELGMALGVPLSFTLDGSPGSAIPWPILELVVSEKRVSWDWLLTGKGERDVSRAAPETAAAARKAATSAADSRDAAPRFETRDLARVLLTPQESQTPYTPPPEPDAPAIMAVAPEAVSGMDADIDAGIPNPESSPPRPSSIKSRLQKEIARVESFLEDT